MCFCKLFFPVKIATWGKRNMALSIENRKMSKEKQME